MMRQLQTLMMGALIALSAPVDAAVWAVDDGEKIARDDSPFQPGADMVVWRPGEPIRLFVLRDEVVAFQIVVEGPAEGVTVELGPMVGPRGDAIAVDRFVEHFFQVKRSSTDGANSSLGWAPGSGPAAGHFTGALPDALIPIELAPAWAPWPMRVAAKQNGLVWIDLTVPRDQEPATYRGQVTVRAGEKVLGSFPLELEVFPATMPAWPIGTMLFYERTDLEHRIGNGEASERQLLQLFHRHRVAPLHTVTSADSVRAQLSTIDGSFYTAEKGYVGPAAGVGDGNLILGTYGMFGKPNPDGLVIIEKLADEVAAHGLFDKADVVLYAEDEDCTSPRGAGWRNALATSRNQNAHRIRVGWTCSLDPLQQPVDVPIVAAESYDPGQATLARAAGKETWIYNGFRPATGTMLTDTEAISLRTDGWIAAMAGIPRWFIWQTTRWAEDDDNGVHHLIDPFTTAETYHNRFGEAAMGDGILVYPGRQVDGFVEHSLGFDGVIPSIRLKNLRRGVEDAGYYELARGAQPAEANRIARALFPRILGEARPGDPPAWPEHGKPFFEARRALAQLIAPGADPGPLTVSHRPKEFHLRLRTRAGIALALVLITGAIFYRRRRRRV